MKYLLAILFSIPIYHSAAPEHNLSEEEVRIVIDVHNQWRQEVGVPDLEWSDKLAEVAADWAKALKKKGCAFQHSSNSYGENLFTGTSGYYDAEYVINAWGGEKKDYDYERNKCKPGKQCGHYTQMVWESTRKVGCAKIECDGRTTWVCNYDPPGNYVGRKPY